MRIYHGSEKIIKKPEYDLGKPNNDFGKGFYCTQDEEKAKEWACKRNNPGVVNEYEINLKDLKILDLTDKKYSVLNWISILLKNRSFNSLNSLEEEAKKYFIKNYYIDVKGYDIVIGYRADDSYFSYAQSFINNSLSVESLLKAMELGNLGKQIVLVSKKAFEKIKFKNNYTVDKSIYYYKYIDNDSNARKEYKNIKSNKEETYILDLIRKGKTK